MRQLVVLILLVLLGYNDSLLRFRIFGPNLKTSCLLGAISRDDLGKMTVAQLKSILRTKNLPLSGLKSELLQRLAESMVAPSVEWTEAPSPPASSVPDESERPAVRVTAAGTSRSVSGAGKQPPPPPLDHISPSSLPSFLDFDDSVFDVASAQSRGSAKREFRDRDEFNELRTGNFKRRSFFTDADDATLAAGKLFKRTQQVQATILKYGPLGASVRVDSVAQGLVLTQDIVYWQAKNGAEPQPGETIPAYVESVRPDGKINVSLRPVGIEKIDNARNTLLQALESQSGEVKSLPLGDRSTPEEIWLAFPGMSKGFFKAGVGYLLRLGAITIESNKMTYVPEDQRVAMTAQPYSGKSPRGWKLPEGATLFVGNLAFNTDMMTLARAVEQLIGYGKLASVQISKEADTGKSRGYAYLSFFTPDLAHEALQTLSAGGKWLRVDGREIRFESQLPKSERERQVAQTRNGDGDGESDGDAIKGVGVRAAPRDWGASSLNGIRGSPRAKEGAKEEHDSGWVTVYAGDLPYKIEPEALQFVIEDALGEDGLGSVAAVRITKDYATGKPRGFGFIGALAWFSSHPNLPL